MKNQGYPFILREAAESVTTKPVFSQQRKKNLVVSESFKRDCPITDFSKARKILVPVCTKESLK